MGPPGSTPDATLEDVRGLFAGLEEPSTPLAGGTVAERLECSRETAHRNLEALEERGEVRTRVVDGGTRVWWRPGDRRAPVDVADDREEFTVFVDAVEDYAIFMLDPDGVVVSWNEGAERIKGYAGDEIVGQHFSTFYTESAVADDVPDHNLRTAAVEGRVEDEGWRVRADGSRFWANVTITAIRDDDGALKGFTKVTRDMTERREYEQELRRERDLTEQIVETVPVSICLLSGDGDVVRANRQMAEWLGLSASEVPDHSLGSWEVYDEGEDPVPAAELPWRRVAETGDSVRGFECWAEVPNVGRRWLSIDAAPLGDAPGGDEQVVVSVDDVTEQKYRQRHLRREYNQTQKLLRTAPIAIEVQNADRETVMANERAQEAFGLSEQEFKENPVDEGDWEVCDSDGEPLPADETPSAVAIETGEPVFNRELIIEPPDREPMQFRINAAPLYGEDGEIERVVTAGEEITELKRRERELEREKSELETELSEILGRISDAFYALDTEWRFTHLNGRAAEIMQRPKDELLGRVLWDEFPDAADGVFWDRFHEAMETQEPTSFEVSVDDPGVWLEVNAYPSETGVSVYFRDITDQKARERELTQYETIVETINDGIYVKDDDGRFTNVNEAYAELTGYDRSELIGEHASLVVDEATIQQSREVRTEAREVDGSNSSMTAEIQRADGTSVPTEGTLSTFETEDGERKQVGVVRDITERVERERRLEELVEKLEESNERLEQFAYAASHDLQEPLRMVSSYLRLLERRCGDDLGDDGHEFLEFAVDGADRMREMIDGLLKYSRVDTRGDPFEPVDLDAVLDDVREDLQVKIEEHRAEIAVGSLPRVVGDEDQLRQLFQNLLDNAIEYSGEATPRVEIAADPYEGGDARASGDEVAGVGADQWLVSVSDNGIGIDPDDADRIFEVFHRLHAADEHDGTGIGLALCKRIVERHDGDIWVESQPGAGSTFCLTVPAADESVGDRSSGADGS